MRLRPISFLCLLIVFSFVSLRLGVAGVVPPSSALIPGRSLVLSVACAAPQIHRCQVAGRKCVAALGHYQDKCFDEHRQCIAKCGGYRWLQ